MKERIVYIDVLRGIAMFAVVYSHILLFCLQPYPESIFVSFLRKYMLSGFFFVSGYMTYKQINWNISVTLKYIYKKIKTLLIPTVVMGGGYIIVHNIPAYRMLFDCAKMGYWFTYTLFIMSAIYSILMLMMRKFSKKWIVSFILVFFSILMLIISRTPYVNGRVQDLFSLSSLANYFLYFIVGIIAKIYENEFNKYIVGSSSGKLIITAILVLSYVIHIPSFITNLSIVLFVYFVVKDLVEKYSTSRITSLFSYIGKNTIEIYFLHYFLLFQLPTVISKYLLSLSSSSIFYDFPELLIVGSFSILICLGCIFMSMLLKQIPLVKKFAFGK